MIDTDCRGGCATRSVITVSMVRGPPSWRVCATRGRVRPTAGVVKREIGPLRADAEKRVKALRGRIDVPLDGG